MSRWLEPPLKVPDALQKLLDAIYERENIAGIADAKSVINNFPVTKTRDTYSNAAWIIYDIYVMMVELAWMTIVWPDELNKWVLPYPIRRYGGEGYSEIIGEILTSNGFNPDYFFFCEYSPSFAGKRANLPVMVSDPRYYEAAYFWINNYLRCFADLSIYTNNDYGSTPGKLQRYIVYKHVTSGSIFAENGEMICKKVTDNTEVYEKNPFIGSWKISVPIKLFGAIGDDTVDFFSNPKLIASYEQIIEFNGASATYTSRASEFVDINAYKTADEALLIECIGIDVPTDPSWGVSYGNVLDYAKIFLTESNFPKIQNYYDPPQ